MITAKYHSSPLHCLVGREKQWWGEGSFFRVDNATPTYQGVGSKSDTYLPSLSTKYWCQLDNSSVHRVRKTFDTQSFLFSILFLYVFILIFYLFFPFWPFSTFFIFLFLFFLQHEQSEASDWKDAKWRNHRNRRKHPLQGFLR